MAIKIMPGETKIICFGLPDDVSTIDSCTVRFYQDDEEILEYSDSAEGEDSERFCAVEGEPNNLYLTMPRDDTLLFENRIRAQVQIEWDIDGFHKVAKATRVTVGEYLNLDEARNGEVSE